jgi:hypothetical protein
MTDDHRRLRGTMIWFCLLVPFLLLAFVLSMDSLETRLLGRSPEPKNEIAAPASPSAPPILAAPTVRRHRTQSARHRRAPTPRGPRTIARLHLPR